MTAKGGFTRQTLAAWGVPWPPPKGWKASLLSQGIEAGTAETGIPGSGRKAESPVPVGDAPEHPDATDYRNRAERAEAECKELREMLARSEAAYEQAMIPHRLEVMKQAVSMAAPGESELTTRWRAASFLDFVLEGN